MNDHYRTLFRYATRFSRDREFIKDAIQDLFLYLWERRASLRTEVAIKPYLMASLRRFMHRNQAGNAATDQDPDPGTFDYEFSVEDQFITSEASFRRAQHMQQVLTTLPRRQKEVIYLKYFQELDRTQIAEVMAISPQTVSNLLQLALRQLRRYWKIELLTFVLLHFGLN